VRPVIVIAYKPGQLANRLLQFAAFIAFSESSGFTIVNPSFDEYAPLFPSTARDVFCRYPPVESHVPRSSSLRRWLYGLAYYATRICVRARLGGRICRAIFLDWDQKRFLDAAFVEEIGRTRLVFVQGWRFMMPSATPLEYIGPPGNIEPYAEAVRRHFVPDPLTIAEVDALVRQARQGGLLVGVHIRQGDFLTDKNQGRYYYSADQYAAKMREVVELFRPTQVSFLVCSDKPQPSQAFDGLSCVFGGKSALVDLYALARCERILGPPSSFSLWASFYGDVPLCWLFDIREPILRDSFKPFASVDQDEYAERFYGYVGAKRGVGSTETSPGQQA